MKKFIKRIDLKDLGYELEGSLDSVIEYLLKLQKKAKDEGLNYRIESDIEYGSYGDRDHDIFKLIELREESDEEFEERCKVEQLEKEAESAAKRELFEKLKKELGE